MKIYPFLLLFAFKSAHGVLNFKTIEVGSKCLYVSTTRLWPYVGASAGGSEPNLAEMECEKFGGYLADMSAAEIYALVELKACHMHSIIPASEPILVGGSGASGNCVFFAPNETFYAENERDCLQGYTPGADETHNPPFYACLKDALCNEIPNCPEHETYSDYCWYAVQAQGDGPYADGLAKCNTRGGNFPRILNTTDYEGFKRYMLDAYGNPSAGNVGAWLALTSNTPVACNSIADCTQFGNGWYWAGLNGAPNVPLASSHLTSFAEMLVNDATPTGCLALADLTGSTWKAIWDLDCSHAHRSICLTPKTEFRPELPDHVSGQVQCPMPPPNPPAAASMIIDPVQPTLMCPGKKAKYTCQAGGVNVRLDDPTKSAIETPCKADLSYDQPTAADWPVCVDKLDCLEPEVDSAVMNFDWTSAVGVTPPFTVTYDCKWPNKFLVSNYDLSISNDQNLRTDITITCQQNGTYDYNIDDFSCTRPCPFPSLPDPEIMQHDWVLNDTKPEIHQEVRHTCKFGRDLVSKKAFETGEPTNLYPELMSLCTVDGWMNETIGSYTCTKPCGNPTNHSEIFNMDWTPAAGTDIGVVVEYTCRDSRKKVVNIMIDDGDLLDELNVTCLYNGQYDIDVLDYGCNDCQRRPDPPNGRIECESKTYKQDSRCYLVCDPGYVPLTQTMMTCIYDLNLLDHIWDIKAEEFVCVEPVGFVIGGIGDDKLYTDEVEILSPGFNCNSQPPIAPYPYKIIGVCAGFILGNAIACGGARFGYTDCRKHLEGSNKCATNTRCIETKGGALWCTGPKIDECYTYDPYVTKNWKKVANLRDERAHAGSLTMPDGTFWILGGAGQKKVLDTVEILNYRSDIDRWFVNKGPKLPTPVMKHCVARVSATQIVIAGGFSSEIADYLDTAYVLDTSDNKWTTKPWTKFHHGPRFDMACMSVNWFGKQRIVMMGGWNNTAMKSAEIFNLDQMTWDPMQVPLLDGTLQDPMPYSLRGARMAELAKVPVVAGGVTCTNQPEAKPVCARTNKVMKLIPSAGTTDPTNGYWVEMGLTLDKPISGQEILMVPRKFVPQCYKLP